MTGHIMAHELRLLLRDRILLVLLPLYAILVAYGIYNGVAWKDFLSENTRAATRAVEENLARLEAGFDKLDRGVQLGVFEDPRSPGRMARTTAFELATKPPAPAAALAIGQSDVYPSHVKVQWKPMFRQTNTDETENPTHLRVGRFDLSFVLTYLYPLLIIALSFNILSLEREGGTQALLLSQPVSIRQFVVAKVLLRGLVIVGVALLLSLLGAFMSSPELFSAESAWRVGAWMLIVIAYGVFWFSLAILVNACAGKSSSNAMILVTCWLALVVIVPGALNLIAKTLHAPPSRIELVQALRRGDAIAAQESGPAREAQAADLAARAAEETEVDTMREFYQRVIPVEARAEAISAPTFEHFETQLAAQRALAQRLKFLSPAVLAQFAMSEIADNSSRSFADFADQVQHYHERFRHYFRGKVLAGRMLSRQEALGFPRFQYRPEADAQALQRLLVDLGALVVFALAALLAGFARLRNYPAAAR